MAGISELIQTIGAMFIFSLVLLSANRMIQRNNFMMLEGQLEGEAVALAMDIMEEARTKEFDENSQGALPPTLIPDDFVAPGSLGPDSGENKRSEYDDFDDYHGTTDSVMTEHGPFYLRGEVTYVTKDTYAESTTETTYKKLRVYITSDYLTNSSTGEMEEYYLEFIRNYYAD